MTVDNAQFENAQLAYEISNLPAVQISANPFNTNPGMNMMDLSELGAAMVSAGLSILDVRALIGEIQQVATQAATTSAAAILNRIRAVQASKMEELMFAVSALPVVPPVPLMNRVFAPATAIDPVSRAEVVRLLRLAMAVTPRENR